MDADPAALEGQDDPDMGDGEEGEEGRPGRGRKMRKMDRRNVKRMVGLEGRDYDVEEQESALTNRGNSVM